MPIFQATIQHDDKTFEALAHMQYDLFCKSNRVARTILSAGIILLGLANSESWWGILAIGYGCYLSTSTYSAANHTAHKLSNQLRGAGMEFPASRYEFTEEGMKVITLPEEEALGEPLAYSDFRQLGEDREYFYIFRDQYGGYMIPKDQLEEELWDFRMFVQERTGLRFWKRKIPAVELLRKVKERRERPYRL